VIAWSRWKGFSTRWGIVPEKLCGRAKLYDRRHDAAVARLALLEGKASMTCPVEVRARLAGILRYRREFVR
jgi:hypothetical protein